MTTAEVLRGAINIVQNGWTQGTNARNSFFDPVPPDADSACEWCLMGAVYRSSGLSAVAPYFDYEKSLSDSSRTFEVLEKVAEHPNLAEWNDSPGRKVEDVLALLKRALEQEKSK